MSVKPRGVATYMLDYTRQYREQYQALIIPPPRGEGYPPLDISPYLSATNFTCHIAQDGVIIEDSSASSASDHPDVKLPSPRNGFTVDDTESELKVHAVTYGIGIEELNQRLMLSARLPSAPRLVHVSSPRKAAHKLPFWQPLRRIENVELRNVGYHGNEIQFTYLEYLVHLDDAAWDVRSIWARVRIDVHRDYADAWARLFYRQGLSAPNFYDRLAGLDQAIKAFDDLLTNHGRDDEEVFHAYLKEHPELLDVYAQSIVSKEQFVYPDGTAPDGKGAVIPDFIICYPDRTYTLVEIERPDKRLVRQAGQPRGEVTQATYQLTEFDLFITRHPDVVEKDFPGISYPGNRKTMLVMGRATAAAFAGLDHDYHMAALRSHHRVDYVYLYDHLLARAQQALAKLSTLTVGLPSTDGAS